MLIHLFPFNGNITNRHTQIQKQDNILLEILVVFCLSFQDVYLVTEQKKSQ